ncbi:MAG: hypothetical protein LBE18_03005, partial [Planctomycetaceae bacterium]|nr:hypothetical protein [Planctomycetaceae bacterium]
MTDNKHASLFNLSADNADNNKTDNKSNQRKFTDWHRAFASAMQLELKKTGNEFDYNTEYQLPSHTYYIDLFVIRHLPEDDSISLLIEKLLRLIDCFLRFTFCEYKSINDT